jgi:cytochrome c peroxidase
MRPLSHIILLLLTLSPHTFAASLEIQVRSVFNGEVIQPGSLRYQSSAREAFSITRLSYLLSEFALQRTDGSWHEFTNRIAWFDLEKDRSSIRFADVPGESYRAVRFQVGLDAKANHADIATLPADHPLNPNLNGLHWSWQGGYIFLALEGMWRDSSNPFDGWSYHLARDTNSTRINVAAPLALTSDTKLELDFDLATLLNAPRPLSFARDGSSTHSREGDPIASALVANLPGSFRVRRVSALTESALIRENVKPLYLPEQFTPYRFQMSATFPIPDLPRDNPLIVERVALGEKLFKETALSRDGSLSCVSCHQQNAAFADPRRFSLGVRDQTGVRNAMPLFNLAWKDSFFWDGRAPTLRAQVLMPIQDHTEMDEQLTNIVRKLPIDYPALFQAAFGSPEISSEKISLALEQFILTLTSFDSKFDRALKGETQLSEEEQRGAELFMTEYDPRRQQFGADCFHCHGGPLFQSQTFANNGLDSEFPDSGRAKITGKESDRGRFATPSLRNVALTSPYMHDGRFQTLEEVVNHYSAGVQRSATLDPNLAKHPSGGVPLTQRDKAALVSFLKTLTDNRFCQ